MRGLKTRFEGERSKTRFPRDEPRGGMPVLGLKPIVQLKCIHTNAHNMGNKQEELETSVQWESLEIVAITECVG